MPSERQVAQDFDNAKPATAEEQARFLEAARASEALAPTIMAANTLGGMDPTGLSRMVLDAEVRRRSAEVQKHFPAMMALNRQRAESYCASKPSDQECQKLRELQRKAYQATQQSATAGSR
jgi:hypothetical protein